jgi:acyl dehydratase
VITAPSVGDSLPEWTVESVDAQRMKTMAALLADPNPIHWDVEAVRSLGLGERPVNQGPTNMAYVANMLAAWAGGHEHLVSLRVRFLANVFAGDRLNAGGTVVAVEAVEDGVLATCEVWLRRGDDTVLMGRARVSFLDAAT